MLEPFIVNLAGTGKNYLKIEIGLELSDEKLKIEVENKLPQIKDAILLLLTSKTFEVVQSSEGKLALKNEIQTRLNTFMSSGAIKNIYFTNFVVQ
jgi:flagellar FliL protein